MKKMVVVRGLAAMLCLLLIFAVPVTAASSLISIRITGTNLYSEAWNVLQVVNEEREACGLPALQMDRELLSAAMRRAAELSVNYSFTRPDGTRGDGIVEKRKVVAENIAAGQINAEELLYDWLGAAYYKNNILSENFRSAGVGVYETGGVIYWEMLFDGGSPRKVERTNSEASVANVVQVSPDVLSLFTRQGTKVELQIGDTFEIGAIRHQNPGWSYANIVLPKENFTFTSANKNVATVENGVITGGPKAGETTVTVSLTGAPAKFKIEYTVVVTEEKPLPHPPYVQVSGEQNLTMAWEILDRINEERAAAGMDALAMDSGLLEAAQLRSEEISFYYSHTRPDGSGFETVVDGRRIYGENIGVNYASAEEVMNAWMASFAHRDNILFADFISAGIAAFRTNGQMFFAVVFDEGRPRTVTREGGTQAVTETVYVSRPAVELFSPMPQEVTLEIGKNPSYTFIDVWNRNVGWRYATTPIFSENLAFVVADPSVVQIHNGTMIAGSPGTTTVSVSIAGIPEVALEYTVTVKENIPRRATINGADALYMPDTTIDLWGPDFFVENRYAYRFICWTCVDAADGTPIDCIADPVSTSTYFIMPDADVVITAKMLLVGDLDEDGIVNSADVLLLTRLLAGSGELHPAGDIDGDGGWNVGDLVYMKRYIAGTYTPDK